MGDRPKVAQGEIYGGRKTFRVGLIGPILPYKPHKPSYCELNPKAVYYSEEWTQFSAALVDVEYRIRWYSWLTFFTFREQVNIYEQRWTTFRIDHYCDGSQSEPYVLAERVERVEAGQAVPVGIPGLPTGKGGTPDPVKPDSDQVTVITNDIQNQDDAPNDIIEITPIKPTDEELNLIYGATFKTNIQVRYDEAANGHVRYFGKNRTVIDLKQGDVISYTELPPEVFGNNAGLNPDSMYVVEYVGLNAPQTAYQTDRLVLSLTVREIL